MAFLKAFDMTEKFFEAARVMFDVEFVQHLAVRQTYRYPVTGTTDIYCNSN